MIKTLVTDFTFHVFTTHPKVSFKLSTGNLARFLTSDQASPGKPRRTTRNEIVLETPACDNAVF